MKQPHVSLLKHAIRLMAVCAMLLTLTANVGASGPDGFWLITPEEAAMAPAPPDKRGQPGSGQLDVGREPPDTGPVIEVLRPLLGAPVSVPLEISVKFVPRGGAPVDMASLKVTLMKLFGIDITDRVRPYASPAGIQIPDARLPSGEHTVRITVADASGGVSQKHVTLVVP
ncbi:MAG: hypothetical protein D4R81_00610 [Nitrospiraceae bacterium]|nr:MAG: hypothetical protein D4R81_00610 [Nitrospiraceae bacterium]